MENPITTVKNSLTVSGMVKFIIIGVAVAAIADWLGVTNWLLYPVSSLRSKYASMKATAKN